MGQPRRVDPVLNQYCKTLAGRSLPRTKYVRQKDRGNGFVYKIPVPRKNIITFCLFVAGEWIGWSEERSAKWVRFPISKGFLSSFWLIRGEFVSSFLYSFVVIL